MPVLCQCHTVAANLLIDEIADVRAATCMGNSSGDMQRSSRITRNVDLGCKSQNSASQTGPECSRWKNGPPITEKSFDQRRMTVSGPVHLRYEVENCAVPHAGNRRFKTLFCERRHAATGGCGICSRKLKPYVLRCRVYQRSSWASSFGRERANSRPTLITNITARSGACSPARCGRHR
jgi:hypothetical protein